MPVYREPIIPHPLPKPPDMPIDSITLVHKPPTIKDESIDGDAIEPKPNMEFEEHAPQQEGIIHDVYERPGKEYLKKWLELHVQVDSKTFVQRYLPRQADLDKILKIIYGKVIKNTHLLVLVKGILAGYSNILFFKDVYLYLAQNRLPSHKAVIRRTEILAERYLFLVSLLFKLNTILRKESAVLALPESCVDRIITLYHSSIFAGHQHVIKSI